MQYDYQYTVIAILISLILLILIYQRKSYSSASNRVFMSLLYINLLAAGVDLVTYRTISFPDLYPVWFLYLSNIVYLWLFGIVTVTFLRYITALTGDKEIIKIGQIQYDCALVLEGLLLLTTRWTRWIIYYDGNLVYHHGCFFWIMYLIPIFLILRALLVLLRRDKQLHYLQRITAGTVFGIAILAATFQILNPRADIFHIMCLMILLVIYIVFENPAYYTYHMTRCLNSKAFYEEAHRLKQQEQDPLILLIGFDNRPQDKSIRENVLFNHFMDGAAERLRSHFGRNIYCLAEGKFVLVHDSYLKESIEEMQEKVRTLFADPLDLGEEKRKAIVLLRGFRYRDVQVSDDFIDHLIEGIQQTPKDRLFSVPDISRLFLEQHEYREVEDALRDAVENDHFFVMYQPIHHIATGSYYSAEALLRFKDPQMGTISPDIFIPIAEKNGSIVQIGEMVLEKVCAFLSSEKGMASGLRYIEVNVSPVQLLQKDMGERFIRIMEKYRIESSYINLEITESSLNLADSRVLHNIEQLQRFGVTFSLDDYGSGFASADYLFRLPITIVKIDRSILVQAMQDANALLVFEDTICMVKKLGKQIVVEGAETREMADCTAAAGGDYIQGYYYSRPLMQEALTDFLSKR